MEIKKTSEEWNEKFRVKIIDPIGWDEENFEFSWFDEYMSKEKFLKRVFYSEVSIHPLKEQEFLYKRKTSR